ncbi:S8 family serine peptidase [Lentzea sp. HUAS12]|uniref:S8 family serine peptidase n=1 Tax=Lentzea sp. HUAS12 TaxID=2951806 RepID=UPI00209E05B5|nr:S8 family serine peptidase [Lentzea sp. HUAS12]USX56317.1 S8 family serine peptidase [Lentzea sp. HUAS12]
MGKSRHVRLPTAAGVAAAAATTLNLQVSSARAAPAGEILSADSAGKIAHSYIAKLKDTSETVSSNEAVANTIAARHSGVIDRVFGSALRGFTAKNLPVSQAKRLVADPTVEYVEQDWAVRAEAVQNTAPLWVLARIDQANLPLSRSCNHTSTEAGVTAYVLDTGVRVSHSTSGGLAGNGYDFIDNGPVAQDGTGHGTRVASTIAVITYRVAKAAKSVAVRVLDGKGGGTTAGVIAGIDWVTANAVRPTVANMSLDGGVSAAIVAVRRSIASGVT